jgi:hypothetical protein
VESVKTDVSIREFLCHLVGRNMKLSAANRRLDFLNASPSLNVNGSLMAHQLEILLNVSGYLCCVFVLLDRLCFLVVKSSWLLTQRSRVRFPALRDFLSSSGSGTGSTQPL